MKKLLLMSVLFVFIISCTSSRKIAEPETKTIEPELAFLFTGYVITDNTNVRKDNTTRSKTINSLNDGEEVRVLQNQDGWYEIMTLDGDKGWVRTDLVGTIDFSNTKKAEIFQEQVIPQYEGVQFFIDENDPYRIIYFILPQEYYQSKDFARRYVRKIAEIYQKTVYPGEVEIRILNSDKSLFTRDILQQYALPDLKAPYLPYGYLHSVERVANEVKLNILVPAEVTDEELLKAASETSNRMDYNIKKLEIFMVNDSKEGREYFDGTLADSLSIDVCRLYYIEDGQGVSFMYDFCLGDK